MSNNFSNSSYQCPHDEAMLSYVDIDAGKILFVCPYCNRRYKVEYGVWELKEVRRKRAGENVSKG